MYRNYTKPLTELKTEFVLHNFTQILINIQRELDKPLLEINFNNIYKDLDEVDHYEEYITEVDTLLLRCTIKHLINQLPESAPDHPVCELLDGDFFYNIYKIAFIVPMLNFEDQIRVPRGFHSYDSTNWLSRNLVDVQACLDFTPELDVRLRGLISNFETKIGHVVSQRRCESNFKTYFWGLTRGMLAQIVSDHTLSRSEIDMRLVLHASILSPIKMFFNGLFHTSLEVYGDTFGAEMYGIEQLLPEDSPARRLSKILIKPDLYIVDQTSGEVKTILNLKKPSMDFSDDNQLHDRWDNIDQDINKLLVNLILEKSRIGFITDGYSTMFARFPKNPKVLRSNSHDTLQCIIDSKHLNNRFIDTSSSELNISTRLLLAVELLESPSLENDNNDFLSEKQLTRLDDIWRVEIANIVDNLDIDELTTTKHKGFADYFTKFLPWVSQEIGPVDVSIKSVPDHEVIKSASGNSPIEILFLNSIAFTQCFAPLVVPSSDRVILKIFDLRRMISFYEYHKKKDDIFMMEHNVFIPFQFCQSIIRNYYYNELDCYQKITSYNKREITEETSQAGHEIIKIPELVGYGKLHTREYNGFYIAISDHSQRSPVIQRPRSASEQARYECGLVDGSKSNGLVCHNDLVNSDCWINDGIYSFATIFKKYEDSIEAPDDSDDTLVPTE